MRSEIGAIYGPLVIAASGIAAAVAITAGEEEGGILALVLAHPIERGRLVLAKGGAVAAVVVIVAVGTWIGLLAGVAAAGGGISTANLTAMSLQLAFFGFAIGALALALGRAHRAEGGCRGRRRRVRGARVPDQRFRATRRRARRG